MQDSLSANPSVSKITAEMAYEGVNNYCHKEYDWSAAEDNPDMMYIQMGEETETEYQVLFRSYTGAFVYFYVDKTTGTTKMVEKVPSLGVEEESGTINLFDYIEKKSWWTTCPQTLQMIINMEQFEDIILIYLAVINVVTFFMYGVDKKFSYGVPIILIAQVALIIWIYSK